GDPDAAEVKRMYTVPDARGRGVALALLRGLEEAARRAGRKRIVLETGHAQPEAIALYHKAGYARIPDFGHYKDEPGVRSYGQDPDGLDVRVPAPGSPPVRVGHVVAEARPLATDVAHASHGSLLGLSISRLRVTRPRATGQEYRTAAAGSQSPRLSGVVNRLP